MPPKRRPRGTSKADDLFQYNNQIELTFKSQPKEILAKNPTTAYSSESEDDDLPILKKKGRKSVDTSSESSPASDSDDEITKKSLNDSKDDIYEIPDDDNYVRPRPLTPPPNIQNIAASGISRQAGSLTKTVGEKMRYLQYLQNAEQETPSPAANLSDVVIVQDDSYFGTPTSGSRNITVRIRIRDVVERFSLKRNETFEVIFNKLAEKYGVNINALSLSFTDTTGNFQTLKGTDTPNSVNLSIADIIDCVVVNSALLNESFESSDNMVNIKFQGSDSKSVKQFKALKNEPLHKIMEQYADFRQLPLAKLKFSFDGEMITSEQSPDDLDMDDENVVDVAIK